MPLKDIVCSELNRVVSLISSIFAPVQGSVDSPFLSSCFTRCRLSARVDSVIVDLFAPLSRIVSVAPFIVRLRAGHICAVHSCHIPSLSPVSESTGDGGGVMMSADINGSL